MIDRCDYLAVDVHKSDVIEECDYLAVDVLYRYTLFYTAANVHPNVHRIQLKKLLRIIHVSLAQRKSFQICLVRGTFQPECLCKV